MKHLVILIFSISTLCLRPVFARPLISEEVETVGLLTFEAGTSVSLRADEFGSPPINYETVNYPFYAKFGFWRNLEAGFSLKYLNHRLDSGRTLLKGSATGLFSTHMKYALNDHIGISGSWNAKESEEADETLPIGRGNDYEVKALMKLPVGIPVHLNSGYVWKGSYRSTFGVPGTTSGKITPGDIFQNSLCIEFPIPLNFRLVLEGIYYQIEKRKINDFDLEGSDGEAADFYSGLSWAYEGWFLEAGVGFGLLDEQHTSFDLERGAGDITGIFKIAYRLYPHRLKRS